MNARLKKMVTRAATIAVVATVLAVTVPSASAQSDGEAPRATEIGVSDKEIRIAIIADVDNSFAPGLFQGAVDGVKGAAAFLNSKAGGGGVAGRKLVVDFIDSHVNPNDSRNATISACGNDLAMVGGAIGFLTTVEEIVNCRDQAGEPVGLPDMDSVVTSLAETCAPTSFPAIGAAIDCSTKDSHPQTYRVNNGDAKWLRSQHKGGLHGAFVYSNDSKDSMRGGQIVSLGAQEAGIKADQSFGVSGRDPQSVMTTLVQKMKADGSNYSLMTHAANLALELRSEAALQGLNDPNFVWACVSCYANKIVSGNPGAFEGEYQSIGYLPFDEGTFNKALAAFDKYVGQAKADQFAAYSWIATLAFAEAVKATVATHGINGLTRPNLIQGIKSLTDFDAGGMAGTHNFKTGAPTQCFVEVQFRSGKWVRVYPQKKGTMDCKTRNAAALQADLASP